MKSAICHAAIALFAVILLAAPCRLRAAAIHEDFNDGLAANRWSVVSQQEVRPDGSLPPDGSVDFAFDYSTLGIANPDGGVDTTGAFLQFNKTDQTGDEGESYSIYPNGFSFTGGVFPSARHVCLQRRRRRIDRARNGRLVPRQRQSCFAV